MLSKYYVALAGETAERLVRESKVGAQGIVRVSRPEEIVAVYNLMAQYAAGQVKEIIDQGERDKKERLSADLVG